MTTVAPSPRPSVDAFVRLTEGLRAGDYLIAKATGASEVSQIMRAELRTRDLLIAAWEAQSKEAAARAAELAEKGKDAATIAAAVDKLMGEWAGKVTPAVRKAVKDIYRLARIAGWRKAARFTTATLAYDEPVEKVQKAAPLKVSVNPSFDVADTAAANALVKHQLFWIGQHYKANVSNAIAKTAKEVMVEAGQNRRKAGALMADKVANTLAGVNVPNGYRGTAKSYFEGLTANAATVARVHGQMRSFQDIGITTYEIVNPLDERTCPVCGHMNGKTYSVKDGMALLGKELSAKKPADVKSAHPWAKLKTITGISTPGRAGTGNDALVKAGLHLPPFHFRCRCTVDVSDEAGSWDALEIQPAGEQPAQAPAVVAAPAPALPAPKVPVQPAAAVVPAPAAIAPRTPVSIAPMRHESETADPFSLKTIAGALNQYKRGKPFPKDAQLTIRRQLNALCREFGLHNHDLDRAVQPPARYAAAHASFKEGPSVFLPNAKLSRAGVRGSHAGNGTINIEPGVMETATKFANGDEFWANSFRTFVHEALHGHTPLAISEYGGRAVALEEATTEICARRIMDKKFSTKFLRGSGSYQRQIDQLVTSTRTALEDVITKFKLKSTIDDDDVWETAAESSLELKRIKDLKEATASAFSYAYALSSAKKLPAKLLEELNDADKLKLQEAFRDALFLAMDKNMRM